MSSNNCHSLVSVVCSDIIVPCDLVLYSKLPTGWKFHVFENLQNHWMERNQIWIKKKSFCGPLPKLCGPCPLHSIIVKQIMRSLLSYCRLSGAYFFYEFKHFVVVLNYVIGLFYFKKPSFQHFAYLEGTCIQYFYASYNFDAVFFSFELRGRDRMVVAFMTTYLICSQCLSILTFEFESRSDEVYSYNIMW